VPIARKATTCGRYEVSSRVRPVEGWSRALWAAKLDAGRTGQAVSVWFLWQDGSHRDLRATVFPDGRWVRPPALHRTPRGFGL
jgi:hypothetical protein